VDRPGWSPERQLLALYVTFAGDDAVAAHVGAFQDRLLDVPTLDLIPRPWLHITLQGVTWADGLDRDAAERLVRELGRALARTPAMRVEIGEPAQGRDALFFPVSPPQALMQARDRARAVLHDALGPAGLYTMPGQEGRFSPHVSFAYANAPTSREDVQRRLEQVPARTTTAVVDTISLVSLRYPTSAWTWDSEVPIALEGARMPVSV
jgi:hypothetical protein